MTTKVLAVDDEPDVLRLVSIKLRKAGFDVVTARDGAEGLEKALSEQPDVVILDVMMPKMDGFTVLEQIRANMSPQPVVLMLTAKGQDADLVRGLTAGADDYVTKPFSPRELVSRVNVALIKAGKPPQATS